MITTAPFPQHGTIVFHDSFGATRLTLPKKLKTVRNYTTARPGAMRPLRDGVVLSGLSYPAASKVCDVPAFKASTLKSVRSSEVGFSPDGTFIYQLGASRQKDGSYQGFAVRKHVSAIGRRGIHDGERMKGPGDLRPSPPLALGGDRPLSTQFTQFTHIWDDGRFITDSNQMLAGGIIDRDGVKLTWVRPITIGLDPLRIELRAEGDAVWLMGEFTDENAALLARFGTDGSVDQWRFENALEAPAYHQGHVALRVGPTEFVRFRLDAPDERESFTVAREHLELNGGRAPKQMRKGGVRPIDERGRVMMLGDQLLYLPWHGEHILNLTATAAKHRLIPRKLPAAEFDLRTFVARDAAELRAVGRALKGSIQLRQLWMKKGTYTWHHEVYTLGNRFWGVCLDAVMYHHYVQYRMRSLGEPDSIVYGGRSLSGNTTDVSAGLITADEVREGLQALAAYNISALGLVGALYREMGNKGPGGVDITPATLFTPEARGLIAAAIRVATGPDDPPYAYGHSVEAILTLLES